MVKATCDSRLKNYSIPDIFKIRSEFPLTPNGKRDIKAMKAERDGFYCFVNGSILKYDFDNSINN